MRKLSNKTAKYWLIGLTGGFIIIIIFTVVYVIFHNHALPGEIVSGEDLKNQKLQIKVQHLQNQIKHFNWLFGALGVTGFVIIITSFIWYQKILDQQEKLIKEEFKRLIKQNREGLKEVVDNFEKRKSMIEDSRILFLPAKNSQIEDYLNELGFNLQKENYSKLPWSKIKGFEFDLIFIDNFSQEYATNDEDEKLNQIIDSLPENLPLFCFTPGVMINFRGKENQIATANIVSQIYGNLMNLMEAQSIRNEV